jgi:hypothetical protein
VRLPQTWWPVLGWCAATATSVALASVAMLPVLRTAAPDDGALVSIEQLRDSGAVAPSVSVPPAWSPSPSAPVVRPSPSRPRRTSAPASPTPERTSAKPATATTVEDGWTVTTDGAGEKTYVRSFRVEGGTTVLRVTADRVQLVTATPSDGYSVQTVQNSPDNLAVYFNEVNHSFVIHAVWHNDKPFVEISEIGQ